MKLIFLGLILFFTQQSQSQITTNNITIINTVYKYSYFSTGKFDYKSNLGFYANAQAGLQARYDYYWKMINNAWGKVKNCTLINTYNNEKLKNKNIAINQDMISHNHYNNVDLAANGAFAEKLSSWITDVFNDSGIKAEIQLLKAINTEYYRLKNTYPDDFYKRDRYIELTTVLTILQTCDPKEIGNLSTKYGLW